MNKIEILRATHYGLHIFAHILSQYYKDTIVLKLVGEECDLTWNPFNANKLTLKVSRPADMFCYQDTENAEFKGNAFDFASLFYHLSGEELMEKINQDLNLHIGRKRIFYDNFTSKEPIPLIEWSLPRFSFYYCPITNTKPFSSITLFDLYKMIKGDSYKPRTLTLRGISDPVAASKFKRTSFDYATPSGVFSKRSDPSLIRHSELLILDFDHVADIPNLKKILLKDPSFQTEMMFISPSGNGLKWLISVDIQIASHQNWFKAVAGVLKERHGLEVDKSGKDISRACFIPYDPDVYINPDYIQDSDDPDSTD